MMNQVHERHDQQHGEIDLLRITVGKQRAQAIWIFNNCLLH